MAERDAAAEEEEVIMYTIYVHKNKINGMCYVGQTSKKPTERWYGGSAYREDRGCLLGKAIKEFGWDAFEHIILETGLSKEEADEAERRYTEEYNSVTPNGYNTDSGGKKGNKKSNLVREHFKERKPYERTEETRRKISESAKKRWQDPKYRAETSAILAKNSKMISENSDRYFTSERRKNMSEKSKQMWATADDAKKERMMSGMKRG